MVTVKDVPLLHQFSNGNATVMQRCCNGNATKTVPLQKRKNYWSIFFYQNINFTAWINHFLNHLTIYLSKSKLQCESLFQKHFKLGATIFFKPLNWYILIIWINFLSFKFRRGKKYIMFSARSMLKENKESQSHELTISIFIQFYKKSFIFDYLPSSLLNFGIIFIVIIDKDPPF
jgi:hypothetical protein